MGHHVFEAPAFGPVEGETFPELLIDGTNFTVNAYGFSAADNANEAIQVIIGDVQDYTSTLAVEFEWYAVNNTTTNDVVWDVRVAALTPETDVDVSTDTLAAAQSVTDTHLGTTSKRLHTCSVSVTNTDSLASGDKLVIVCRRNTTAANADDMANDAALERVIVSWS